MKRIIQFRWFIACIWIVLAVGLLFLAPNLQELVREKGQITVPQSYPSQEAAQLIGEMSHENSARQVSAVLVFHDEAGLTELDKDQVILAIEKLEEQQDNIGISDILAFTADPKIAEQTVSEDQKTIIVPFQVSLENQDINESREKIYDIVKDIKVEHYVTGESYIQQDIITNSEEGLKKTEFITIGLILIILFVVFKSFVAPFIPLVTVGISYLIAQGIVAILADTVNFPLSTFTQIFMVAIMFGIGTDYCILLISRFKEEIARHDSIKDAVLTTYKASGKTVFFAGLAVLVGFSTIGLSTFSLYQSAVSVAVGVAVVLIALTTLVPFFLIVLGKKLFWPFDKHVAHKESKLWGAVGNYAWTRPILALLIILAITVPSLLTYDAAKSYNSLEEVGDQYGSVKGFNWIADSFGPGQIMLTTVVMESMKPIESSDDYQAIESLSQELAKLDGVKTVRSATRPAGEIIEDFLIDNQTSLLAEGIDKGNAGIHEIQDGLQQAAIEINNAAPQLSEAQDGVNQLMQGTNDANHGISEIHTALTAIQKGIQSGSQGTQEIIANLQQIKDNLDLTITGNKKLLSGYQAISVGLQEFGSDDTFDSGMLEQLVDALQSAKSNIEHVFDTAITSNPALQTDQEFMQAYHTAQAQLDGTISAIHQISTQLEKLATAQAAIQSKVIAPLTELNNGFQETISGQEQLTEGIKQLLAGMHELQSGLTEAANGQGQVVNNLPILQDGLAQIYGGQEALKTAFSEMQDQLHELSGGLGEGASGLQQIHNGLNEIKDYLGDFSFEESHPVVIIPEEALDNEDFIAGTKPYLSADKTIVKFDVVLEYSPYSTEAIQMITQIKAKANDAKLGTIFEKSQPKIGGISSVNNDLQNISDADYSRTVLLMVAGIFIVLVVLLKSFIMPIYLIGSLVLTYFTTMAFTELIFVNLLGYDGLTWAVPFFSFVILMALGIDYSIFLMDRFNEYRNGSLKEALLSAMRNMGTVIISAAIILGGTFAAMLPSGVLSLLQIATAVIVGLFLYAFVMLPLFIPVMVRMIGKLNWWPFKK